MSYSSKCRSELVERLSRGVHKVSFEDRVKDPSYVEERIKDGFVFVKFTQTKGETELGINLIQDECDFSSGDFKEGTGKLHVVGTCELNYCKIKCIADVSLTTRDGIGHLELIEEQE
jgi:hypothetical protein